MILNTHDFHSIVVEDCRNQMFVSKNLELKKLSPLSHNDETQLSGTHLYNLLGVQCPLLRRRSNASPGYHLVSRGCWLLMLDVLLSQWTIDTNVLFFLLYFHFLFPSWRSSTIVPHHPQIHISTHLIIRTVSYLMCLPMYLLATQANTYH